MKILMVVLIAILFGVVRGFVGGSMVDVPEPTATVTGQPRDRDREMMEALKSVSAGAEVARQRQRNVMIGGVVGLAVGVAAGVLVASRFGNRPKRASTLSQV